VSDNRRSSTRHDVEVAAHLTVKGQRHDTTIRNLSLGGASLSFAMRVPMGERVTLRFQVPQLEEPIDVQSTVRWSTGDAVGVQFDGLRARDVYALGKFFETLG
jgi:hypothetical protein